MKRCPACNGEFDNRRIFCPDDGVTLRSVEADDPMLGRVIEGKYAVEEQLGRGGMGAVYRARHLLIGDHVAIKVLRADLSDHEDAIERLRREARATRNLKSPHTVGVIDFSATEDGMVYLVMEFVQGTVLRTTLESERRLGLGRVVGIVNQIAEALDQAHEHGIIHRDLKPDNVMLESGKDGRDFVRVLDFGIAKLSSTETKLRTLTTDDVILGTPCYLSPEQCGSGAVGPWSDVYSLGVMIFEMVTGQVPFDGRSALDVARQHMFSEPPMPSKILPGLSEPVEAVILRSLAKDPEDRYRSAGELARAFDQAVALAGPDDLAATLDVVKPPTPDLHDTGARPRSVTLGELDADVTTPPGRKDTSRIAFDVPPTESTRKPGRRTWVLVVVSIFVLCVSGWVIVQSKIFRTSRPSTDVASDMVLIPAGRFQMGSDTARPDCQDEHPPHAVDLPAFYLDRTEVTNQEYKAFCDATGRQYPPEPGWDPEYFLGKPDYPVINVTWQDANDFAKWMGKRLPTEAEWERAARGDDGRLYPWGDKPQDGVTTVAGLSDGYEYTAPVGSFPAGASPFGCLDMIGNVYEWVDDWYQPYPGSDGSWDQKGDTGYKKRCIRGGSFTAKAELVDATGGIPRASERYCEKPDYRSVNLGFRCAKTP